MVCVCVYVCVCERESAQYWYVSKHLSKTNISVWTCLQLFLLFWSLELCLQADVQGGFDRDVGRVEDDSGASQSEVDGHLEETNPGMPAGDFLSTQKTCLCMCVCMAWLLLCVYVCVCVCVFFLFVCLILIVVCSSTLGYRYILMCGVSIQDYFVFGCVLVYVLSICVM